MNRMKLAMTVVVAVLAGLGVSWWYARSAPPPAPENATVLDVPRPLPELALIDQAGKAFGRERLAGRWSLLFFGFTHCPDICPITLALLADVRAKLSDLPEAGRPQLVFVSVDPARDTPATIARYVAHFDPEFVGVTGTAAHIERLTGALGVPVFIGPPAADGAYTVDHGAAIFVIDPSASWHAVASAPHASAALARDYRRILAAADTP